MYVGTFEVVLTRLSHSYISILCTKKCYFNICSEVKTTSAFDDNMYIVGNWQIILHI
jgi:hypothetical protein